jgi:DNA-binding response OmpR family regulator
MVVEDDLSLLYSISFTLKRQKYLVGMASNGQDALRHLQEAQREEMPFQLLVTDIVVPGLDGLDLIDRLREHGVQIPILVITANADKNLAAQLEQRGIRDLLAKPFNSDELVRRISSVLAHKDN